MALGWQLPPRWDAGLAWDLAPPSNCAEYDPGATDDVLQALLGKVRGSVLPYTTAVLSTVQQVGGSGRSK